MLKKEGCRYIVNAGSVGQPRDGDPRACYAIVDENRIELVRVAYDIQSTQKKMSEAGSAASVNRKTFVRVMSCRVSYSGVRKHGFTGQDR